MSFPFYPSETQRPSLIFFGVRIDQRAFSSMKPCVMIERPTPRRWRCLECSTGPIGHYQKTALAFLKENAKRATSDSHRSFIRLPRPWRSRFPQSSIDLKTPLHHGSPLDQPPVRGFNAERSQATEGLKSAYCSHDRRTLAIHVTKRVGNTKVRASRTAMVGQDLVKLPPRNTTTTHVADVCARARRQDHADSRFLHAAVTGAHRREDNNPVVGISPLVSSASRISLEL